MLLKTLNSKITLKLIFTVSLTLLLLHSLIAKPNTSDSTKAQDYYDLATEFSDQKEYDSALVYFQKAEQLFERSKDWPNVIKSLHRQRFVLERLGKNQIAISILKKALTQGENHLDKNHYLMGATYHYLGTDLNEIGKYDNVLSYFLKGLEIRKLNFGEKSSQVGSSYLNLGIFYQRKNDFDKALYYYEFSLGISLQAHEINLRRVAFSHDHIGAIHYYKADYRKARTYMERALEFHSKRKGTSNYSNTSLSLNNLGAVAFQEGNYQKAYNYYSQALAEDSKYLPPGNLDFAADYFNLAEVHHKRLEYNEAIKYYDKALQLYLSSYGRIHYDVSEVYGRLGSIFLDQGNIEQALAHYQEALDIAMKVGGKLEITATIYEQFGDIFMQREQFDSAKYYVTRSLNLRREIFGEFHPSIAESHLKLVKLYSIQNQWKQAIDECEKALSAVSENLDSSKKDKTPSLKENVQFLSKGIDALNAYGKTIHGAYQADQGNLGDLQYGFNCIKSAIDLIDQKRIKFSNQESRHEFSERYSHAFDEGIAIASSLAESADDHSYWKEAFQLAERNKAFVLSQSIQEKQLEVNFALEDSLVEKERSLKIDIAYYKETLFERRAQEDGYDTAQVAEFTNRLFDLERKFESLKSLFETQYPNYYKLKYNTKTIGVEELQKTLANDEALIEYFWGSSTLYAFTVSAKSFSVEKIPIDSNLVSSITNFNTLLRTNNHLIGDFSELSNSVFQSILEPSLKSLSTIPKKLIIIPDGLLGRLNFDLLLTKDSESVTSWKDLPYLLKDFNISNAYAATLLFNTDREIEKSEKNLLAFSFGGPDVIDGNNISLQRVRSASVTDLPGSIQEIKSISELVDGDYCYGKFASEGVFKETAPDYQILHLAVHGEVDDEQPSYSKLYFNATDTLEDGLLHAYELYNMSLNAELAVLSACNTGTGKYLAGEGIMSLGRAFSYAGVNSLLLSRWDVPDDTTPEIMSTFYRELKNGKDKSEALREAKLNFLNQASDSRSHPFFWGSFYILGDDTPIDLGRSISFHFWIIGLGLLGVAGYLVRTRKTSLSSSQS